MGQPSVPGYSAMTLHDIKARLRDSNEADAHPIRVQDEHGQPRKLTDLERIVVEKTRASKEWADAKKLSDGLKAAFSPFVDQMQADVAAGYQKAGKKPSEALVKREARSKDEIIDYIVGMVEAERQTNYLRARVEGLEQMWESARTKHADERSSNFKQGVI